MAFVPDPAPRSLPLSAGISSLFAESQHLLGRLSGSAHRLVNPQLLGAPLMRREAILSSRIEGTVATAEEVVLVEIGGRTAAPDALEIENFTTACWP